MKLIATKSMTYATRRLQAGEQFEAGPRDARLLIAIKKAKLVDDEAGTSVPTIPMPEPVGDLAVLRAEYKAIAGKAAFNGWNAEKLREKIAKAQAKA
ncbi:hypothetical protein SAMN04515648_4546 [Phyllobacterium sp. CL33Tsu]|uniref:hypothetical protein n=1 Tax=Phyllobacterium sp. CL33Tsu TaxID=1798191 RepID=UPI0008E69541|nr:hypothetical protein [Phyllobacterium sp. CL33Tsu]SFJ54890.1 hypothetical protein SAMN04515648_4546 [Phyllobacterium sp. CL33Tsu]